jgi:hypothetical protein
MNIINTPVISVSNDAYWEADEGLLKDLLPKNVLIITTPVNADSAEENLLHKIIEGCKLQEESYNLIQLGKDQKIAWHLLRDKLQIKSLVLFGIETEQLGVNVQLMPHQTNRFNNCNWIPTASLDFIIQYPEIKNHLWVYGLKPVFIDKIYS